MMSLLLLPKPPIETLVKVAHKGEIRNLEPAVIFNPAIITIGPDTMIIMTNYLRARGIFPNTAIGGKGGSLRLFTFRNTFFFRKAVISDAIMTVCCVN